MRGWGSPRGPGWSPLRFAWRSALGSRRGQTAALVAVAALTTACTSFAPVYDRTMQQALVDTLLAGASASEKVVVVQSEAIVNAGGETESRDPRDLQALVPEEAGALLGQPVLGRAAIVTPRGGDIPPTGPLVWRDGGCAHVDVLSGVCPQGTGEIMVSDADVEIFGLDLGSTVEVRPVVDGPDVRLEVVGTYAPRDADWWQGTALVGLATITGGSDPSAGHDAWLTTEDTFVDAAILSGETSQVGAPVPTASTGVDELLVLEGQVRQLSRDLRGTGKDLHVVSALDETAEKVAAQSRQAHRTVPLLVAPVAVLTLFVLWLVLAAATDQRRGEVAVARLRGRGPRGAVGLLLLELLPVLLVGVVPGVAAALLGGVLARALLPGRAPFEAGPGFVTAVLLAVAALVLTTVAAAVRVAREPLDSLVRSGRASSGRWTLGARDALLLACVGTGALAFAAGGLSTTFALAGPALLALFAGLVAAHAAAPAASAAGRRLLRRGHLVAGVTLLETGRRRDTRAVVVVVTVACALAVFSVDALVVGERNRANASEHDAGAPVVLRLDSLDLDGVRAALSVADADGRRTTPVMVAKNTLAVEPEGFRRVAFFPRGAPTSAEWSAIAPPESPPVTLTGSRLSLTVQTSPGLSSRDIVGDDSELRLGLAVTTATGVRSRIPLGAIPAAGGTARLVADDTVCVDGCRLAAIELVAAQGVSVDGSVDLSGLRVDGRPVDWGTSAEDWNPTEDEHAVITPSSGPSPGVLRLDLGLRGFYPAQVTPAWVPSTLPALLTDARTVAPGLVVTGVDGTDRAGRSAGSVVLVPAMPRRSALVDLDAVTRGSEISFGAHVEVWLADDAQLVTDVEAALRERGILVTDLRRFTTVRQAYSDTVATWSLALGAVIGPAVLLLALLVLLVLVVIGWRDRARDLAILRLNGAGRRTTRRLAASAQLPAVLLGVVTGVAAGVAGAVLAMPDVLFFPAPPETPVVDVTTAWPAVLWVAAACATVLPVAAALAARAVARRAHLELVREAV